MAKQDREARTPQMRFEAVRAVAQEEFPAVKAVAAGDEVHALFAAMLARTERGVQESRKVERARLAAMHGEDSKEVEQIDGEIEAAETVLEHFQQQAYRASIDLGVPARDAFIVRGLVTTFNGKPANGVAVIATTERGEGGKAVTGNDGQFTLRIPVEADAGADKGPSAITIRIEPRSGPGLQNADTLLPLPGAIAWREYTLPEPPAAPPLKRGPELKGAKAKKR